MTTIELHDHAATTYGFANRWTAKIYLWCRNEFGNDPTIDNVDTGTLAEDCRTFITEVKGVPDYRLRNVDFHDIALALYADLDA